MVETWPIIAVGTVTAKSELFYYETGADCPLPYTVHQLKVATLVHAKDAVIDDLLPLAVQFGPEKDPERCWTPYVSDDPLFEGQHMLVFARKRGDPAGPPGYAPGQWFEVGDDGLLKESRDSALNAGPAALVGLTVDEAVKRIAAAIAEAPLPDVPTWMQPYVSPAPTEEPSAAPDAPTPRTASGGSVTPTVVPVPTASAE
jgi:hypothetical protein